MKKLFALFLVAGVLVVASCGSKKSGEEGENTGTTEMPTTNENMTSGDSTAMPVDTTASMPK